MVTETPLQWFHIHLLKNNGNLMVSITVFVNIAEWMLDGIWVFGASMWLDTP